MELQIVGQNAFKPLLKHMNFSKALYHPFWLEEHQKSIEGFAFNMSMVQSSMMMLKVKKRYYETLEGEDAADWEEER